MDGGRISLATWKQVKAIQLEGDEHFKKKEWRRAIDTYQKIQKYSEEALKAHAQWLLNKVNIEGELIFTDVYLDWVKYKMRDKERKLLEKIIRDFSPLKVAAKAEAAIDELKHKH